MIILHRGCNALELTPEEWDALISLSGLYSEESPPDHFSRREAERFTEGLQDQYYNVPLEPNYETLYPWMDEQYWQFAGDGRRRLYEVIKFCGKGAFGVKHPPRFAPFRKAS
jgi:hypothetical protein